jgi:hypothetical protein
MYPTTVWGIFGVFGLIHDEYTHIALTAKFFGTIVYTTLRIFINTLFSSSSLLLDVSTLLALQFLLARCGDVHPNPDPCRGNKSKISNQITDAKASPISTNGEPIKVLGTSINLIN